MNPQQAQGDFYSTGYAGSLNRSPSSARSGYAAGPTAMAGSRRAQPQFDHGHFAHILPDDRFAHFDAGDRFDRGTPAQGLPTASVSASFFANQGSWTYSGGASTINGPMNDGSRRAVTRRPALHTEWTANDAPLGSQAGHMPFYTSQPLNDAQMGNGELLSMPQSNQGLSYSSSDIRSKDNMADLIPTAIVIKNIPFNVRKEVLTAKMIELNLPVPYAFNYHFDQGVFRGLAFANFQNPSDTAVVIQAMNGLDMHGRKLRVEYKKMLPEHERERIEREKREKRGQLEEQHRGPSHQASLNSLAQQAAQRQAVDAGRMPKNMFPGSPRLTPSVGSRIDLNDATTLRYYLQLFMFKQDDTQEIVVFPSDTSPEDRRLIHILAHNMGLEHTSLGENENRQIHVSKAKFSPTSQHNMAGHLQQAGVAFDSHPRGLSRAATYDFHERSHPPLHQLSRATLAVPGSPEGQQPASMLRGVKSFADLRSYSPSPSPSNVSITNNMAAGHNNLGIPYMGSFSNDNAFGPALNNANPAGGINTSAPPDPTGLANNLGSLSLGTAYDVSSNGLGGRASNTPGAIGSQRPGANGASSRANPERQPRGPGGDWEASGGFGGRGRVNGHVQRGSDSSDNTGRLAAASGAASLF